MLNAKSKVKIQKAKSLDIDPAKAFKMKISVKTFFDF
jgi:hypothetical protein